MPGAIYHQFAIAVSQRDQLETLLARQGIATKHHYSPALHMHSAFADCEHGPLPRTEALAARTLSLPIQPEVVEGHLERIIHAVRSCMSR